MSASCDEDVASSCPFKLAGGESPVPGSCSPAPLRNPSPPNELIGLSDSIGRTAFSKHWFFTTLMKLIKVIEKPKTDEVTDDSAATREKTPVVSIKDNEPVKSVDPEATSPSKNSAPENGGSADKENKAEETRIMNIDDDLQDELCQLWDMSSDEDVAKLLQEYKAVELLSEVITQSEAPRATEIAVGILGNMACTTSVCESMADCMTLVDISLCLLTNSDTPTLVEATRFLSTVLSSEKCQETWLEAWRSDTQHCQNIAFILSSSVNRDLISNTANLLDNLLDLSDVLCASWSSVQLVTSIIEALKQLGLSNEEGTYSLLHSLQLISTQTSGVSAIVDQVETIADVLVEFLLKICEDEIVNLEESRSAGVASAVSVLNIMLTSSPAGYSLLYSGGDCIRCLLKIIYACDKEVVILGTPKSSPSLTSGNSSLIRTLKEVLYVIIAETVTIMNTEETDVSQTEDDELSERTTPSLLNYMNSSCERPRLIALINLLLSRNGQEVIKDILDLCSRYKLTRLEELILDCGDTTD